MRSWYQVYRTTLIGVFRDRVFHSVFGVGLLILVLVPIFAGFSMRQVRELAVTLSLGTSSLVLVLLAVMFGATSIWRDIEKRYTAGLLGLPISRSAYLVGRFCGLSLCLAISGLVLGGCSALLILLMEGSMSAAPDLVWANIFWAFAAETCKAILLLAVAVLFSTLSTSLFLPVFGSCGVLLAGSASQEVIDYLATDAGRQMAWGTRKVAELLYYVLPNFSIFDFSVQAIYGLPVPGVGLALSFVYFCVYTVLLLFLSGRFICRRELP